MKIALLADPHLSDLERTPQEEGLDWAIEELRAMAPDACVWLGDITACGSPDAALRFLRKSASLPCPSVVVPGNSDLRTEATAVEVEQFLFSHPCGQRVGELHVVGMNTSHNRIFPEERERLSRLELGKRVLLCSHQSAKYLDADSLAFLRGWLKEKQREGVEFLAWVNGHRHKYCREEFEGIPAVSVRALDLDKCIGGSAQILLLHWDGKEIALEEKEYSRGLPSCWREEQRQELLGYLGITCYNRTKRERDMPFAIEHRVPHLEWRSIEEDEISLIEQWRSRGGKTLSLHAPSTNFIKKETAEAEFRSAVAAAVRAGADMITVHPPYLKNAKMGANSPTYDFLADANAEALLPAVEAGIDVVVENNHTSFGTPKDSSEHPIGCTPISLISWRNALNRRLGKDACHLRLDIGHARNNMPLSQDYPLGKWYAAVGAECRCYHLHQTFHDKTDNRMHNHQPITDLHDGLVAFDGFLWAWHSGLLHHGPIILEIREGEGAPATWQRLQSLLG